MPSKKGDVLWSRDGGDGECDDTELIKMWDESMESFMDEMKAKKAGSATRSEWNAGDYCRAKYRLDGQWYEAEVVKKLPQKRVVVEYIGYKDHEEVDSCMLRASKGQECREIQKQECFLAEYEDEEDSDEEQSENHEEDQVVAKEDSEEEHSQENIALGKLRKSLEKAQEFQPPSTNFIRQQNQIPKPKENKGRKPMPSYTPTEQKEEAEISALRKLSIQNRKMKGVGRSGGEPYSIPEGNYMTASYLDNVYAQRNEPLQHPYPGSPSNYGRSDTAAARSEPYAYANEPSDYGKSGISNARSESYPYANGRSDYGMPGTATTRSEQYPDANEHFDYGRDDRYLDQLPAKLREILTFASQRNASTNGHAPPSANPWNKVPPSRMQPPSSYLPPHPSYGGFRHRAFPGMVPPPPIPGFPGAPFQAPHVPGCFPDDTESLTSLLTSWFVNGYNTGYYMGLREARQDSERFSSRHHT